MTTSPAERLAALAVRYWAFQCEETPAVAFFAGRRRDDGVLMREAPSDHERRAASARVLLCELAAIPETSLPSNERTTFLLLKRELEGIVRAVACKAYLRPSLFPFGPEATLSYVADVTSLGTEADRDWYKRALTQFAAGMQGVQEALAAGRAAGVRYPKLIVERACTVARSAMPEAVEASKYFEPLMRAPRKIAPPEVQDAFKHLIAEGVYAPVQAYINFLETELAPVARDGVGCTEDFEGAAHYAHLIETHTTLEQPAEEIHDLGLAEVARIAEEMRHTARDAGHNGDVDAFRRSIINDKSMVASSAEALRAEIEILSKRIDARIPEFFGRIPRMTYAVRSIPEAASALAPPAYAQPNPADRSLPGVHWVTSLPAKLPRYMHTPLALHEAWPGHLMHLALIQELEDVPAFRRFGAMKYTACLEGWALYCEGLGEDMGFYTTPELRYGRLDTEMWRACRLVVDTGLHTKAWSRARAIDYMRANLALPLETIEAEVDRYIGFPAQALAYQLGAIVFRALRQQAELRLGDGFRIRDFHDALMAAGPVSLPVLEMIMTDWIDGQKRAA